MKRFLVAAIVTTFVTGLGQMARADEKEAKATIDKAIQAIGGEEALNKAKVLSWKTKGTITFNGNDGLISTLTTSQGIDHYRSEIEGDFNGNTFSGVVVLNGDKGWRKFGDNTVDLDGDAVANEKRSVYLQVVPALLVPLKGKDFKVDSAAEEKVGDKPAAVVKATGPDGKDFTLFFDKESGLLVKMVAKVFGMQGDEFTQETTFANYRDFGGTKQATKRSSKRDGEKFLDAEVSDFKILDKVDAKAFSQPD